MAGLRLLFWLGAYYVVMAAALLLVLWAEPGLQEVLPIGRVQALLAETEALPGGGVAELASGQAALPAGSGPAAPGFLGSLIWLAVAIFGALLASLPVSWVYMQIRNPEDYDQSLVDTIVVLPLVVTTIVVVVQHSLALAFSLAGIAGAARYRNSLKSSGDLLFILLAISIGLAAGIGAVELAVLSSAAFNFCFVLLWMTRFGEREEMKRFLVDAAHVGEKKHAADAEPAAAPPAVIAPMAIGAATATEAPSLATRQPAS